jgi:hypothetical protein
MTVTTGRLVFFSSATAFVIAVLSIALGLSGLIDNLSPLSFVILKWITVILLVAGLAGIFISVRWERPADP